MDQDALVLTLFLAVVAIGWLLYLWWGARQRARAIGAELARVSAQINAEALAQFRTWRQQDLDTVKREQADIAKREALLQLEQWRTTAESSIRADAIQRSQAVIIGKVTEHVAPYMPNFALGGRLKTGN